ncbi:MAG: hypothetical protein HQM06_17160 [Magnetococcales bacterium]|nr:hypothetical protein [Magnetococcales bacterium]
MKIAYRLIREFWIPFVGAAIWAALSLNDRQILLINIKQFINTFAPTFFLLSWIIGQYFRVKRNEDHDNALREIKERFDAINGSLDPRDFRSIVHEEFDNRSFAVQARATFISLRLMPTRFQEAIDSGATSFSFDEARGNLEKLFAIAPNKAAKDKVHTIVDHYNGYLNIIRQAISGEASLEQVNSYHKDNIVKFYEDTILEGE